MENSRPIPKKYLKYQARQNDGFRMREIANIIPDKNKTQEFIKVIVKQIVKEIEYA